MKKARHIRNVVDDLLNRWEKTTVKKGNAVREAWSEITEEETKKHARPVSLKNGTLMVMVDNSSWLYKMTLEKNNVLQKFNKAYKGRKKARDIRFRIGATS